MKKFPAINVPDNFHGYWTEEAGYVRVKEAFKALTKLSLD